LGAGGFCAAFWVVFLIADNCRAKKPGAFLFVNAENMGFLIVAIATTLRRWIYALVDNGRGGKA
jgi:hypothetical protein